MDVETGKDNISVEESNLVVFTDVHYTKVQYIADRICRKMKRDTGGGQNILKGACGALRPGRLAFILGPSGAGKTTLLKILAKRNLWVSYTKRAYSALRVQYNNAFRVLMGLGRRCSASGMFAAARVDGFHAIVRKRCAGARQRVRASPNRILNSVGHRRTGVEGSLYGADHNTVLVAQHASLIDTLTGKETLIFAASLKLPKATTREREHAIESVSSQLGIQDVLSTKAGQMSGGERKRLTIACELLSNPLIMLLDEPTSGLDSVSSMSVARALRSVALNGRTVACVIHQPSSKLFSSADDVILMAEGRTLYAGAIESVPDTLVRAGFRCPQYYNMADYLLEVASGEHIGNLAYIEQEAKSYALEMRKIAKNDVFDGNGKVYATEAEALLSTAPAHLVSSAGLWAQLCALLWRCGVGALRDVHLTQIRLACHLAVALLLGALYNGAGAAADRYPTNTACLFFFLLFLFFSNAMPTINSFPAEATVVLQEHLNKWYSLSAYCMAKIIIDLPVQVLCATLFLFPAWYLTSQPMDYHRMGLAWAVCVLVTILAQTFGLVIGTACDVKLGMFVVPASNIPMLMFSEFFIPYHEMPYYLRPFATISYFRYAFDAFVQAAYGFDREKLPCHKTICMFRTPQSYLTYLGLTRPYLYDIYALLIWIVLLQISFVCVLKYRVCRACR